MFYVFDIGANKLSSETATDCELNSLKILLLIDGKEKCYLSLSNKIVGPQNSCSSRAPHVLIRSRSDLLSTIALENM